MEIISASKLDLAVTAVVGGRLVIVPTPRWYMICADASNQASCERIFAGKQRRRSKSLAYMLPAIERADELFVMTPQAQQLAAALWPGNFAMILRWRDQEIGRRHEAVGAPNALVTMDTGLLGELARRSPVPIAATTANVSGTAGPEDPGPAITTGEVQKFVADTGIDVAYCIEGGVCPLANHLTIVDCTQSDVKTVRSGVVHERAVAAALSRIPRQKTDAPDQAGRLAI